jgi:peptidoglycan/LPS O-acetylase OafA/YrhL
MTAAAIGALGVVVTLWTWQDTGMAVAGYTISALATAVIMVDCVSEDPSILRPLLARPELAWLGRISYGLYLWQSPVYFVARHWDVIWSWQRMIAVGGPATLLLASASYYGVEVRFLRLKGRYTRSAVANAGAEAPRTAVVSV